MKLSNYSKIPKPTNGVLEVAVTAWEDLKIYTSLFASHESHIYRGQADSKWSLVTTLDRNISNIGKGDATTIEHYRNKNYFDIYKFLLKKFKESLMGRGIAFHNMSNDELWALGQHYGLYTPFLDWTHSFYIALYFAFASEQRSATTSEPLFRSVYALGVNYWDFKIQMNEYNKNKEGHTKFKLVKSSSNDNPRVINQAGLFTKLPFKFDIPKWVEERFSGENQKMHFIKINIPESERDNILRELDLMNINPKTIYPDLTGSALDCNYRLLTLPYVA